MLRRFVPIAVFALAAGCATPEPLTQLHAYVWAAQEEVRVFLCRWPDGARVGVSLPQQGPEAMREAAAAALAAWQRVDLPIDLVEEVPERAQIEVRLVDGAIRRDDGRAGSGRGFADCRVGEGGPDQLHGARVEVAVRSAPDARGHIHEHTPEVVAGTVLHELGHALGYQGHPRGGRDEPMVREADALRRLGRRVLAGKRIDSPEVRALYARPTGATLLRAPVSRWRTEPVDQLAPLARADGLEGPFVRSGDAWGRILWRGAAGQELGIWLPNLLEAYDDPTRILLVPDPASRERIERGAGLGSAGP